MKNVNKVFLLGNVSRDPEIKKTASGKKVAVFGIATNRDWTTDVGDKSSITEFHNCIAWGRLADLCEMYLAKGQLVYGEGYLKTRTWDDENAKRQFRTEIVLVEIIILEKFSKKGEDLKDHNHPANFQDVPIDDLDEISVNSSGNHTSMETDNSSNIIPKVQVTSDQIVDQTKSSTIDTPLFEEEK